MRPAARVAEAIAILESIESANRPADTVFQTHVRARRYIGSKDRRSLGDIVFGVIRHHARITWHLAQVELPATPRMRVAAYLVLLTDLETAELFSDGQKHGPTPLSDKENNKLSKVVQSVLEPVHMPETVRVECPGWAEEGLRQGLGSDFVEEMVALRSKAAVDLRIIRRKVGRRDVLERLTAEGFDALPTPHSPDGVRVNGTVSLAAHPLLQEGCIEFQDEGSQLAALACGVSNGMQVVDFCAGAGGKSIALADLMEGTGRVVACDTDRSRLNRGKRRFARAKLDNIETRHLRNERDGWVAKQKRKFDRVLVDAPCTGVGAWRRNPWSRWTEPDLTTLTGLQGAIIASAGRLVRPGGWLIYVTCSLLPSENQHQLTSFLEEYPNFRPISASDWPQIGELKPTNGSLLLTPRRHGTDGFFIAILQREAG